MEQEKVSEFIKKLRKDNNLTQKDLAEKYGVTYQAVSKWENGKNIPDMLLLKQMSKDFNISLDDIFEGVYSKENKKKKKLFYIVFFLLLSLIFICLLFFISKNNEDFHFKTISSNCDNFTITGSLSYNDNKSAIYISNIEYCDGENNEFYKSIECTLYENSNDTDKKIATNNYDELESILLEDYLKNITFTIDNYSRVCNDFNENSLYLVINATGHDNKITHYKIPLSLDENCNN